MTAPSAADGPRPPLRLVFVTDTMADLRMLEGIAGDDPMVLLTPQALGDDATNWWPPRTADIRRVELPGGRLTFVPRAAWWLRRHRDQLDAAVGLDLLVGALAANLGRVLGGPPTLLQAGRHTVEYIRWQRGLEPAWRHHLRLLLARILVTVNLRLASGVAGVSEHLSEVCRRHNPNVVWIPAFGVDTEQFAPTMTRDEARRAIGLPTGVPIVMWRSRLAPEKDPHTFLEAVRLLRQRGRPELCALYMGGEHAEFSRLAESAGVEVVAGKPRTLEEIPLWYIAADVDVQTSHAEGLGLSPLEALACGTPIVVSDVGGLPETVDGGRCGALVPHADVEATAAAIARFLDDPDLAARTAADGRQMVVERFSAAATFERWHQMLAALARGERLGHGRRHTPSAPASGTGPGDRAGPGAPRPLRVLYVDHETRLSGGQRDLVDLVAALPSGAIDAHVALPGEGPLADALRAAGATVHVVEMGESLRKVSRWDLATRPWTAVAQAREAWASARRLADLASELGPDLVHTNSMKGHVLGVRAARRLQVPLVWHVRDILEGRVASAFAQLGRTADRILVLSRAAAAPFEGTPVADRVRVVYNGIHDRPVELDEVQRWRDELAGDDGQLVVGIVGQIARWKGQDVFLEAAAHIAEERPDVRFAVVGECLFPENEGAYHEAIRRTAAAAPLAGRVVFTGPVDPVDPLMAALDVFVHASTRPEPFGRVIVEAMHQGTPVVSNTIGSGPELVPTDAGRLVPPAQPAALAEAVLSLLGEPAERREIGQAARRNADDYSIVNTAGAVLGIYGELVAWDPSQAAPPEAEAR